MSGYPQDLLSNRSVVKNDFAIITRQMCIRDRTCY